jgi:transcriptional regulator with GAF, ATPase, and Fis domain
MIQYNSPAMERMMEQASLAARSDSTVLLTGETGSGKDYWARYIQ